MELESLTAPHPTEPPDVEEVTPEPSPHDPTQDSEDEDREITASILEIDAVYNRMTLGPDESGPSSATLYGSIDYNARSQRGSVSHGETSYTESRREGKRKA